MPTTLQLQVFHWKRYCIRKMCTHVCREGSCPWEKTDQSTRDGKRNQCPSQANGKYRSNTLVRIYDSHCLPFPNPRVCDLVPLVLYNMHTSSQTEASTLFWNTDNDLRVYTVCLCRSLRLTNIIVIGLEALTSQLLENLISLWRWLGRVLSSGMGHHFVKEAVQVHW
jgi:hypothetical protein